MSFGVNICTTVNLTLENLIGIMGSKMEITTDLEGRISNDVAGKGITTDVVGKITNDLAGKMKELMTCPA